jgi:hypothetical protein
VVAAVTVLVGSLLPVPTAASDGVTLAAPLGFGLDKWIHAASYAVVAGLAAAGYAGRRDRRAGVGTGPSPSSRDALALVPALVAVVVLVAAFGAAVEAAQSLVPGRTASGADALANGVGAVVGVVGWWAVRRLRPAAAPG